MPVPEFFVTSSSISDTTGQIVGYYTRFQLKRLLFFVTGFALGYDGGVPDDWPHPERLISNPAALTPVWPRPSSETMLTWPPPARLSADDLTHVVQI